MIALRLTVPIASWRRGQAREFLETESIPPPSTSYGALLSLVGEEDRERHVGCRVTAGLLKEPARSTVLRTVWRIKTLREAQGVGENARPDYHELLTGAEIVLFCESGDEKGPRPRLEERVLETFAAPAKVQRHGAWSLGESTHLIDDAHVLRPNEPLPGPCVVFLEQDKGRITLPVWVDHVGSAGTRYALGALERILSWPEARRIPRILKRE